MGKQNVYLSTSLWKLKVCSCHQTVQPPYHVGYGEGRLVQDDLDVLVLMSDDRSHPLGIRCWDFSPGITRVTRFHPQTIMSDNEQGLHGLMSAGWMESPNHQFWFKGDNFSQGTRKQQSTASLSYLGSIFPSLGVNMYICMCMFHNKRCSGCQKVSLRNICLDDYVFLDPTFLPFWKIFLTVAWLF